MTGKERLRAVFWTVLFIAVFAAMSVLAEVVLRAVGWSSTSGLVEAAARGAMMGAGMLLITYFSRREGRFRLEGTFVPSNAELKKRRAELAAQRERLLADARAKAKAAAEPRGGIEPRLN